MTNYELRIVVHFAPTLDWDGLRMREAHLPRSADILLALIQSSWRSHSTIRN